MVCLRGLLGQGQITTYLCQQDICNKDQQEWYVADVLRRAAILQRTLSTSME